jgi:hypothetical protein
MVECPQAPCASVYCAWIAGWHNEEVDWEENGAENLNNHVSHSATHSVEWRLAFCPLATYQVDIESPSPVDNHEASSDDWTEDSSHTPNQYTDVMCQHGRGPRNV